ncbi:transposase family protein [Streptomyces castrisilvae]|uniref:transposase family protein n=1 Tax=Streptomyces castrisilvae TaxID=3033811 RepID=UPI003531DCDE
MPARTSSPIPAALGQLGSQTVAVVPDDVADLRRFLIHVTDPRDARGRRYPALALLCAAVAAVLAGARSLIAVSEWITDAPQSVLDVLGFGHDPFTGSRPVPHAVTVRRLLHRVDSDALDAAITAYLQARTVPEPVPEGNRPARRVIAVDGKVVRGSRARTARGDPVAGRDGAPRRGPGPAAGRPRATRSPRSGPCWTPSAWRTPC